MRLHSARCVYARVGKCTISLPRKRKEAKEQHNTPRLRFQAKPDVHVHESEVMSVVGQLDQTRPGQKAQHVRAFM